MAELTTPTLDGLMMVLTVRPWPFLPPSPSLRRPEIYADRHVVTQRCPLAFSSLFYLQSAICPLILYPLVVIHKSLCQVLKPEDSSRGPKCAMGYHENKSRAVRPCLSVVYRQVAYCIQWLINPRSGLVHRQRSDRSREPHVMCRVAWRGEGAWSGYLMVARRTSILCLRLCPRP